MKKDVTRASHLLEMHYGIDPEVEDTANGIIPDEILELRKEVEDAPIQKVLEV